MKYYGGEDIMKEITLSQLIKTEILQQIQDAFSDYTGMAAITTTSDGIPITEGSNFTNFCTKVIRGTEIGYRHCIECDKMGAVKTMQSGCPVVYRCHAGLVDFAAPVIINGSIIGSVVGGQILTEELDEEFCRKKAAEYNIDPDLYITEAKKAVRMTMEQAEKSAKLIFDISKALSALSVFNYAEIEKSHNLEVSARSQSDYIINVITEIGNTASGFIRMSREAMRSNDPEKIRSTLEIISKEGSGAVGMIQDSLTYLKMVGKDFRMSEDEYDPHTVITTVIGNIRRHLEASGVTITFEIADNIPQRLLGDAGSMCQIIDKVLSLCADHGGRNIHISITSGKSSYAEIVHIKITADVLSITDEQLNTVNTLIKDKDGFSTSTTFQELGLPLTRSLLHSISGEFLLVRKGVGAECFIDIPQLEIKGGDV